MLLSTLVSGRPGADTDDENDDGVSIADEIGDTHETNETPEPSDTPGMKFNVLVFLFIRCLLWRQCFFQ